MNRGIINEELLNKDIVKIDYYAENEKVILNKIYQKYNEMLKNYRTANTEEFTNNISSLPADIEKLRNKRKKYTIILNRVISNYNALSNETIRMFESD